MIANGQNISRTARSAVWANVVLCIFILLAVGYGVKRVHDAPGIAAFLNPGVTKSPGVESLGHNLRLDEYHFELNQVTKMVNASFTISNDSDVPIQDIGISCDFQDRSGNHHGRGKWVVHDTLGAHTQHQYQIQDKRYISHRATPDSIVCRIVDTGAIGGNNDSRGSTH